MAYAMSQAKLLAKLSASFDHLARNPNSAPLRQYPRAVRLGMGSTELGSV
jgi:hypothetical protein